jgi:hypothetical protein
LGRRFDIAQLIGFKEKLFAFANVAPQATPAIPVTLAQKPFRFADIFFSDSLQDLDGEDWLRLNPFQPIHSFAAFKVELGKRRLRLYLLGRCPSQQGETHGRVMSNAFAAQVALRKESTRVVIAFIERFLEKRKPLLFVDRNFPRTPFKIKFARQLSGDCSLRREGHISGKTEEFSRKPMILVRADGE